MSFIWNSSNYWLKCSIEYYLITVIQFIEYLDHVVNYRCRGCQVQIWQFAICLCWLHFYIYLQGILVVSAVGFSPVLYTHHPALPVFYGFIEILVVAVRLRMIQWTFFNQVRPCHLYPVIRVDRSGSDKNNEYQEYKEPNSNNNLLTNNNPIITNPKTIHLIFKKP